MPPLPLVLASASPRRRDLLAAAGVRFEVMAADIAEEQRAGEAPEALASRLAEEKARAVAARVGTAPPRWVLGADTIVVLHGQVFGKPVDAEDAVSLLGRLLGETHRVITAVSLLTSAGGAAHSARVESFVSLRRASPADVRAYVATGEPLDKAGAYALQGLGRRFVERVEGSESNVIGLPVEETLALLNASGADGRA